MNIAICHPHPQESYQEKNATRDIFTWVCLSKGLRNICVANPQPKLFSNGEHRADRGESSHWQEFVKEIKSESLQTSFCDEPSFVLVKLSINFAFHFEYNPAVDCMSITIYRWSGGECPDLYKVGYLFTRSNGHVGMLLAGYLLHVDKFVRINFMSETVSNGWWSSTGGGGETNSLGEAFGGLSRATDLRL